MCSTPPRRRRSRSTSRPGAASSASARRSRPSPTGRSSPSILGTRSHSVVDATQQATIKVADRGHSARQGPAGVLAAHRPLVQLHRQRPRRLARHRDRRREAPTPAATPWRGHAAAADHPSSGARTTRAAAPSTPRSATPPTSFAEAQLPQAPRRRRPVGGRQGRPGLQRLRRDRARQLPADQDLGPAEPERADRLRPAPRRPHHPDRPRAARSACTTRSRRRRRSSRTSRSTPTARTASTARAVDNDFATNKWVYLYYAPPTVRIKQVRRHDRPT